ncbi:hypothetical protein OH687_31040 [Burkholderia anthina]|nr:hypothetical protein OH687_31040 [Burkholderia anthina]
MAAIFACAWRMQCMRCACVSSAFDGRDGVARVGCVGAWRA